MNLKKLFSASLICALFGMISAAENLIRNPEFELSMGSGLPKGWLLNKNAVGEVVTGPDGKNAISLTGPEAGKWYSWTQHGIPVKAGKTYLLKGKFKTEAGTQASIYLECNAPWKTISSGLLKGSGGWQSFRIGKISFDKLGKLPYLVCRVNAPGILHITGLELTEVEPGDTDLIQNGDFCETGKDGQPKWWNIRKGVNASIVEGKSGRYLKMSGLPDGKMALVLQHGIELQANREYIFSAKVKGPSTSQFSAFLESSKPAWQTYASPWRKGADKWQDISFRFKFKDFQVRPYLGLRVKGQGEVLIQNPSVKAAAGSLTNGSFSAGNQGWEIRQGKIADSGTSPGKILELNSREQPAQALQKGIKLEKGRYYELRYQVRGGSDKTHRDSQNAVWFRGSVVMNGKSLTPETWLDSFDSWQKKSIVFKAPADGTAEILLEARKPYCVDFDDVELAEVKQAVPPLELLVDAPFSFRSGVYSANRKVGKAKFTIVNNTVPDAAVYQVRFNGKTFEIKHTLSFELDVPSAYGTYPVKVTAKDASGKDLASVSLPFRVNQPSKREIAFRKDRVMLIDGKPFFPLGVWSVKGPKSNAEKAKIIAECGFNIAKASNPEQMDDFAENGMMVLMTVMERLPNFKDEAHFARWDKKYRAAMKKHQEHPSLIGYFISDEPAWRGFPCEKLLQAYDYIRKIDPYRPIMLNEAPRGEIRANRSYAAAGDIYGVDIYPIPEPNPHSGLNDKNMTSVGKYTDICRQVVYDRKPVWMTLQAFAWGVITKKPLVYPTEHQSRFMAYDAIVHGATGLFWWGINSGSDNWDFVRQLGRTVWELRKMSPVFIAETIEPAGLKASPPEVRILHKKLNGSDWYIAVNESKKELAVSFSHAGEKTLNVFFENRKITPVSGRFQDSFKAYDVHIYSTAEELPPELKIPVTRRMTPVLNLPEDYRNASWIWYPGKSRTINHKAWFKREITLDSQPEKALFFCTADDYFRMYINGKLVMEHYKGVGGGWGTLSFRDAAPFLSAGKNTILIKAADGGGAPCGLFYAGVITEKNGKVRKIHSDAETLCSEDNKTWVKSEIVCPFGGAPWSSCTPKPADVENLGAFGFPF